MVEKLKTQNMTLTFKIQLRDITLEKKDDETSRSYPVCLAGKGACPHEDCGGVWGWEEIKRLFREEPDSDETESYREWLQLDDDEEFDPNHFDIEEVNSKLRMIIADSKDERNESETGVARKIIKGPKPITLLENLKRLDKADIGTTKMIFITSTFPKTCVMHTCLISMLQ
jgi:hypothetical protein